MVTLGPTPLVNNPWVEGSTKETINHVAVQLHAELTKLANAINHLEAQVLTLAASSRAATDALSAKITDLEATVAQMRSRLNDMPQSAAEAW